MMRADVCETLMQEFGCYYLSDELIWEDFAFRQLAKNSAERLSFYTDVSDANTMRELLLELQNNREGGLVKGVEKETNVEWSNDENWGIFQNQIGMILEFLKLNPASPSL